MLKLPYHIMVMPLLILLSNLAKAVIVGVNYVGVHEGKSREDKEKAFIIWAQHMIQKYRTFLMIEIFVIKALLSRKAK